MLSRFERLCLAHGLLPSPVGPWPRLNNAAPSVQLHYTAFIPTTSCSAPVLRFGTLVLAVCAAWTSPLASERQVLTFRTRAWLSFAPPTCRMPPGQASGVSRADPGGRGTPRFRHRLIRFRHFIGGSLALAPLNLACRDQVPTLPQRCQWPRAWGMLAHPLVLVRLGRPDYNLQYRLPSAKPD